MSRITENELKDKIIRNLKIVEKSIEEKRERKHFDGSRMSNTILVSSNNLSKLISASLAAAELKGYEVFLLNKSIPIEFKGFSTNKEFEEFFKNIDNANSKSFNTKTTVINYSKGCQEVKFPNFPIKIKMILVIENFNLWDSNSQFNMARLSQDTNIMVVGQIRMDFGYSKIHVDPEASSYGSYIELEG
jgi:hypothetical protein